CVYEATYVVNMALLKGHSIAGVTLTAKNHYGSINVREHTFIDCDANPMGTYSPFVDLIGHPHLGGKTLLFMIDGLYGCVSVGSTINAASAAWNNLFGGQWSASYFMSLDPVALDSVGVDFLRAEFGNNLGGGASVNCDNYLHEAALVPSPPSGTVYRPDGTPLAASLGVHEHWNNAVAKQYSRNLGAGAGIELLALHETAAMTVTITNPVNNAVFATGADIRLDTAVTTNYSAIARVDFYRNGSLLGTATSSPFSLVWTNAPAGGWALTAVATDADNFTTTSSTVNVSVSDVGLGVAITSPPSGSIFDYGTAIPIEATASSVFSAVTRVDFYTNGGWLGVDTTRPYQFSWSGAAQGSHALTAVATDLASQTATSAVVNITVRPTTVVVAGTLHVDLRATDMRFSPNTWTNRGALGHFTKTNTPTYISNAAGTGIPGVLFSGSSEAFIGPASVADIHGASDRSIEAW
ncbi:MAG: DUF362 domain-containing protein, partial [Verrucomicrobia bacterium]|nr:DUF362 domain-containing protein [Verrucomicrobiota bacterium]